MESQKINELLKLYTVDRLSVENVANRLKCNPKTVSKILKECGVKIRGEKKPFNYSNPNLMKLFNEGCSLAEISRRLNVGHSTIVKWAKLCNLAVVNKQNRLRFDNTVFDVIDTEDKAYWLGFMYADGYVGYDTNQVSLTLAWKDADHVGKFALQLLNHDTWHPVKKKTNFEGSFCCKFFVNNKRFKESLLKKGCIPRKSLILQFPSEDLVPHELLHHFIRGYFDGDGSIITKETSSRKLATQILGTADMLEGILNSCGLNNSLTNNSKTNNLTKTTYLCIEKSEEFLNYIYRDATVYLDRKYNLWKNYCRSKEKSLEAWEGKLGEVPQ